MTCDLLPPPALVCPPPFEQPIGQQMIQLQDSIFEHLHHHTFSNMFSNEIPKAHWAWILSCSGLELGIWFIVRLVFPAFQLFSLVFATTFHMWLGLHHLSLVGIPQCVCTHPIDRMNIHLLCCAHGNERTKTHDAIHNTVCCYYTRC